MARYSALLGRRVEVHYRAGDIQLPATGTLVADSGKSIFLEEHFQQRGSVQNFRWEIPYPCILRISESGPPPAPFDPSSPPSDSAQTAKTKPRPLNLRNTLEEV